MSRRPFSVSALALVCSAALSVASSFASAVALTTISASNINSDGTSGSPGNFTYVFSGLTGAYTLKSGLLTATVEKVASSDAASEKRVSMSGPGYASTELNPGFPSYSGTPARSSVTNKLWDFPDLKIANGSRLTFRFTESVNDSGIDAIWRNFNLALEADPAQIVAPAATNVTLSTVLSVAVPGSLFSSGQVNWYSFTLANPVSTAPGAHSFLDITTNPLSSTALDTEIALYDALGRPIAQDDQSGDGSKSALSFGAGSGEVLNPADSVPIPSIGQNGILPAGTYYIAVASYKANFAEAFLATGGSASTGGYTLNVTLGQTTAIPEPAALGCLLVGLPLMFRRARR